jgi:uncharacterized protein
MAHTINWFEIPATDFDRAVHFYNTILNIEIRKAEFMGAPNGFFPMEGDEVGGAVVQVGSDAWIPGTTGTTIYLNAKDENNLDKVLERVEPAGGKLLMSKTDIGDPGFIGTILDTEGNRVGIHAPRG